MFRCQVLEDVDLAVIEPRHVRTLFDLIEADRRHLRPWMSWVDQRKTLTDVANYIAASLKQFSMAQGFHAGIWSQGTLCGMINCHPIDWPNKATCLEYWLAAPHEGKGIMTASCRAVTRHALDEFGFHRVTIRCATENMRSRAIPERLGFGLEGISRGCEWLNDRFVDHAVYALLKTDQLPEFTCPKTPS